MELNDLKTRVRKQANTKKANLSLRFFKTGKGEYGEGDKFLGIDNPTIRKIAKEFYSLAIHDLESMIKSKFHEERLIALLILTLKFGKASSRAKACLPAGTATEDQIKIYDFYLKHTKYINNWDLVDLSAYKIVGAYLYDKNRKILFKLAKSKNLWERRIAIISTFYFIARGDYKDSLAIAEILINDKYDLIHKAVGWMLREIGKRCGQNIEERFLKKYYKKMPRTMLRYAIEKLSAEKRKFYLNKT
jgi:3-methyladenine DNA glycosylase AlkD